MFGKIFGNKKKAAAKKAEVREDNPENVPTPVTAKGKKSKDKASKRTRQSKGKGKTSVSKPPTKTTARASFEIDPHKLKKGKKPKQKKIERPKPERKVGNVSRVKNEWFPGNVNFKYTSPKENWVSCLGRGKESDVDFGNSVRILREAADV